MGVVYSTITPPPNTEHIDSQKASNLGFVLYTDSSRDLKHLLKHFSQLMVITLSQCSPCVYVDCIFNSVIVPVCKLSSHPPTCRLPVCFRRSWSCTNLGRRGSDSAISCFPQCTEAASRRRLTCFLEAPGDIAWEKMRENSNLPDLLLCYQLQKALYTNSKPIVFS